MRSLKDRRIVKRGESTKKNEQDSLCSCRRGYVADPRYDIAGGYYGKMCGICWIDVQKSWEDFDPLHQWGVND